MKSMKEHEEFLRRVVDSPVDVVVGDTTAEGSVKQSIMALLEDRARLCDGFAKQSIRAHRAECDGAFSIDRDPFDLLPAIEAYVEEQISGGVLRRSIRQWLAGTSFRDPANRPWDMVDQKPRSDRLAIALERLTAELGEVKKMVDVRDVAESMARLFAVREMNVDGLWRCSSCGEGLEPIGMRTTSQTGISGGGEVTAWRWNGNVYEHKCPSQGPQGVYHVARFFK